MTASETFMITIAGETFNCRRPTHGELDLGKLQRLFSTLVMYQQRISDAETSPGSGCAERIGNYVAIAGEAAEKVVDMARRAVAAITDPRAVLLLDSTVGELDATRRGIAVAEQLYDVLVGSTRIPK